MEVNEGHPDVGSTRRKKKNGKCQGILGAGKCLCNFTELMKGRSDIKLEGPQP